MPEWWLRVDSVEQAPKRDAKQTAGLLENCGIFVPQPFE